MKAETKTGLLVNELRFSFSTRETWLTIVIAAVAGGLTGLCVLLHFSLPAVLILFLAVECTAFFTRGTFYSLVMALVNASAAYACASAGGRGIWVASPLFWLLLLLFAAAAFLPVAVRCSRTFSAQKALCDDLLHTVAHDLRSPLSIVLGVVTFLESEDPNPAERTELLKSVESDLQQMLRTMENRLLLTRLADTAKITVSEELAEEVAAESVRNFRLFYPDTQVFISVPQEPLQLPVNAAILEQVIQNLLEVVVYYLPVACRPSLTIFCVADHVVFRFTCRCEQSERLCSCVPTVPDYQKIFGERLTHRLKMGLTVAQQAARLHCGKLLYGADKGTGAVFELMLPTCR